MNPYFGNKASTVTTLLLLGLLVFWIWAFLTRATVGHWGLKTLFLALYGLLICCYGATRDGFDKTVQFAIDGSGAPGLFPLLSLTTIICYIGALLLIVAGIATPIAKSQHTRELWFYVMSGGVALKIITVEISRLIVK